MIINNIFYQKILEISVIKVTYSLTILENFNLKYNPLHLKY